MQRCRDYSVRQRIKGPFSRAHRECRKTPHCTSEAAFVDCSPRFSSDALFRVKTGPAVKTGNNFDLADIEPHECFSEIIADTECGRRRPRVEWRDGVDECKPLK
jgi:hypothetical protein